MKVNSYKYTPPEKKSQVIIILETPSFNVLEATQIDRPFGKQAQHVPSYNSSLFRSAFKYSSLCLSLAFDQFAVTVYVGT